jgi:hypothetical protein
MSDTQAALQTRYVGVRADVHADAGKDAGVARPHGRIDVSDDARGRPWDSALSRRAVGC